MNTRAGTPVLIAGGGIGGLATALALAKRDFDCHVLERRPVFAEEGAGIQIGPNGTRVLGEIGVLDALRETKAAPDGLQVRDARSGELITRLPLGDWIAQRHGSPYWTAHRQDLHAALLACAHANPRITLSNSADVVAVSDRGSSVDATLEDGCTITGSSLIAADGLWSNSRTKLFDAAPPRLAGKSAYRTVVATSDLPAGLAHNDIHIWLAEGAHVVHYPVRAGKQHAFVIIFDEPQPVTGWSTQVEAGFVRAKAQRLAPSLRALLDAAATWRMWSLQETPMPRSWVKGRIALLGDAAHPVLPFLAQGAVLALEDAALLARECADAGAPTASALQHYEEKRRPRALRVQAASRRNGRIYHLGGVLAAARDSVLRNTPPTLLMRQYDWLYGWGHDV